MNVLKYLAVVTLSIATFAEAQEPATKRLSPELEPFRWMIGHWKPVKYEWLTSDLDDWDYDVHDWYLAEHPLRRKKALKTLQIKCAEDGKSIEWTYRVVKETPILAWFSYEVTERLSWDRDEQLYRIDVAFSEPNRRDQLADKQVKLTRFLKKDETAASLEDKSDAPDEKNSERWRTQLERQGDDGLVKTGFGDLNFPWALRAEFKRNSKVVGHWLRVSFKKIE